MANWPMAAVHSTPPPPPQSGVLDGEIKQLQRRVVVWKAAAGLDDLAQATVQRLDCVGGVDHLADARSEREERHDVFPGAAPSLADRWIALAPFILELLEPDQSHVGILGPVDCLDGRQDRLAILPGYKRQTVADQVHDAGLHHGLRIDRGDRLGKALEPIDHRDQDIVDATRLQVVDDLEPEFGAFGLLNPKAQNLLLAVRIERQRDIDGLVFDHAFIAYLDPPARRKTPPDRPGR